MVKEVDESYYVTLVSPCPLILYLPILLGHSSRIASLVMDPKPMVWIRAVVEKP